MKKYNGTAIELLKLRLVEKAMKDSTPKKYAGDMLEAAEVIVQLQEQYKALTNDIRENAMLDICEVCEGGRTPCTDKLGEEFECDTCTLECRCRSCRNNNQWKWRGEEVNFK